MGKKEVYTKKLPLALFVFVFVMAASGTAMAAVDPDALEPDTYVVESGNIFSGPSAIQDSIDSSNTMDGYTVYIMPGTYSEQVIVSKNIKLKGMGANPEDTTISVNTDGNVINVPDGVTVTLKNMVIINTGTGKALSDTGTINLINCVITENYVGPTMEGTAIMDPEVIDTNTEVTDTDSAMVTFSEVMTQRILTADTEPLTTALTTESPTTITAETTSSTNTGETTTITESSAPLNEGIPLTTMAYGMLMVVGGVVLPRKND